MQINECTSDVLKLITSIPQDSVSGPVLYNCYASTLKDYLEESYKDSINLLGYADDHAMYSKFRAGVINEEIICQHHLENVLATIKTWMNRNFMKMNDEKTEYTKFGNKRQLLKCTRKEIQVGDVMVQTSSGLNYLGLFMDEELTFKKHIWNKSRIASRNLFNIRKLRRYLPRKSMEILVHVLSMSHLDYSNGVLGLLPSASLKPYVRVQAMAARTILGRNKYDSVKESIMELHWLPIRERINYKSILRVFKCLHNLAPQYLCTLFRIKENTRDLGSSGKALLLEIPYTNRRTYGDRSFWINEAKIWNKLPNSIRSIKSITEFKKKLKPTYL